MVLLYFDKQDTSRFILARLSVAFSYALYSFSNFSSNPCVTLLCSKVLQKLFHYKEKIYLYI